MKKKTGRLVASLNRRRTVGAAAALMSLAYLLSQLLGLYRQRLLVAHFGVGTQLDAYNAAFRLPDLLFTLLVSGAFAVAFIPVFNDYWQKDRHEEAWKLTSNMLTQLSLATFVIGAMLFIFADPITYLLTPGFSQATHATTVNLTRVMLVTPLFFAIANVIMAVEQVFERFFLFAIAGILYNLGIIAGFLWLTPHFGIYGVAIGVVIGAFLQMIIQLAGLIGLRYHFRPSFDYRSSGVRRTVKLMIPRSLDQGVDQINFTAETVIGSFLVHGSITTLSLANSLKNVPLSLIASSISTATFPQLAAKAAKGERSELVTAYVSAARLILFLAVPAAIYAVVMRGYIVRLLYGYGHFDTASTLGWYAGTIVFFSLFMLVSRVYYAMQDTRTPLYMSLISVPINIVLSVILSRIFGVEGLAMSASITSAFETIILMVLLRRRFGSFGERSIARGGFDMLLAGLCMGVVLYLAVRYTWPLLATDKGFIILLPKFAILSIIATTIYVFLCSVLRVKEARSLVTKLRDLAIKNLGLSRLN